MGNPIDEAVRNMETFVKEYNKAHEDLKKELRIKLKDLIIELAEACRMEETVEKVYQT